MKLKYLLGIVSVFCWFEMIHYIYDPICFFALSKFFNKSVIAYEYFMFIRGIAPGNKYEIYL